jgi:5-formyltetrahydrofolate cyclo-ligase
MTKREELRREMIKIGENLDPRWIKAASRELCAQLSRLVREEFHDAYHHILAWIPSFSGEVDLIPFISEQVSQRSVYLPRILPDHSMTFISLGNDWESLVDRGDFAVRSGASLPGSTAGSRYDSTLASDSIVLVPGLLFDRGGHRLGRAQAYYDEYLLKPGMQKAVKVGVCWELQVTDRIAGSGREVQMDWICHERGYFRTTAS